MPKEKLHDLYSSINIIQAIKIPPERICSRLAGQNIHSICVNRFLFAVSSRRYYKSVAFSPQSQIIYLYDPFLPHFLNNVYRVFPMRYAKVQDVILCVTFSEKCHINLCIIVTRYVATSILMYVYDPDRNFCNMCVLSYATNKKKITCEATAQKKYIN